MRILIAGGLGFVGGRLAQLLHKSGHQVVLGTRSKSEPPIWLPQAELVRTDWHDKRALERICDGIDMVVQAAGMNAQECSADPVAALEFNGASTARLLHASIQQGVKRFIYLSTAHVYNAPLAGVVSEDLCPVNLHPYATSHLAGEGAVRSAHQREEIDGIVIRLSNAIGAPVHNSVNCWMLLVNDLCRQAVHNRLLVMRSTGEQRRDFVTMYDVVRAISHLLQLPKEKIGDGIFNVGGKWAPRVIEVVELIQRRCSSVLGFEPEIERPEFSSEASDFELDYRIDKLLSTGFSLDGNYASEIDATLLLCQNAAK